jgi:hypothetical protein
VNRTGEPFDDHVTNLNRSIDAMGNGTAPIIATGGIRTQVSLMSVTQGTRIGQFNASRNFTNVNGHPDWELADNIEGTRAFRINITDSASLLDGFPVGSNPFTVRVDGASDWVVRIYEDDISDDVIVDVDGVGECRADSKPVIDLTSGTIDGEPCEHLSFGEGVSPTYSLHFENADNIKGNFSVVVDSTDFDGNNYTPDTDDPFADPEAIYAATIHVLHESASHVYATDARAVPGENDA